MKNHLVDKAATKEQMGLVIQQIRLYQSEIELRKKAINELFEKYGLYLNERNRVEDALLDKEHQLLLKHGL